MGQTGRPRRPRGEKQKWLSGFGLKEALPRKARSLLAQTASDGITSKD